MTFLFRRFEEHRRHLPDPGDFRETRGNRDAYLKYLQANQHLFTPSTYSFAVAPWHYDPLDFRCPHDSWVEEFDLRELGSSEHHEQRRPEIHVRLLGAYYNGHLELRYSGVRSYDLSASVGESGLLGGHNDWLVDEVRLSERNLTIHEIRFVQGRWVIECDDIDVRWDPVPGIPPFSGEPTSVSSLPLPTRPEKIGLRRRRRAQALSEPEKVVLRKLIAMPGGRGELAGAVADMASSLQDAGPARELRVFVDTVRTQYQKNYVTFYRLADWRLAQTDSFWDMIDGTTGKDLLDCLDSLLTWDQNAWRWLPDIRWPGMYFLGLTSLGEQVAFAMDESSS